MANEKFLQKFIDAQERDYSVALAEIRSGRKRSHWMWYVFPQIKGLGFSSASKFYAICSLKEAEAYLKHPVLGLRLAEICQALLELEGYSANDIFGSPDDLKLKSSMTLFAQVPATNPVFGEVLEQFFKGGKDMATLTLLDNCR